LSKSKLRRQYESDIAYDSMIHDIVYYIEEQRENMVHNKPKNIINVPFFCEFVLKNICIYFHMCAHAVNYGQHWMGLVHGI
jgi:hypothetical protein